MKFLVEEGICTENAECNLRGYIDILILFEKTHLILFKGDAVKRRANTHTAHRRLLKEYSFKCFVKYLQRLGSKCHFSILPIIGVWKLKVVIATKLEILF